jgi:NAD(P)-dependent dehydrogenase (short-subunit alcohol dehydrogenase family)
MAGSGILVTDVVPGVIDTPLTKDAGSGPKANVTETAREIVDSMGRPQHRVVTPRWYSILLFTNKIIPGIAHKVLGCLKENN